jgi:hypothetical protein
VRADLENPIVGALNTKPKYVASTTLTTSLPDGHRAPGLPTGRTPAVRGGLAEGVGYRGGGGADLGADYLAVEFVEGDYSYAGA